MGAGMRDRKWGSGDGKRLGLLGVVRMRRALVNLELGVDRPAKAVVRNHATDGLFHEQFGMALANLFWALALHSADVAGVRGIDFVGLLPAGEPDFFRIDHHDEV